jgi:hypothetical protein
MHEVTVFRAILDRLFVIILVAAAGCSSPGCASAGQVVKQQEPAAAACIPVAFSRVLACSGDHACILESLAELVVCWFSHQTPPVSTPAPNVVGGFGEPSVNVEVNQDAHHGRSHRAARVSSALGELATPRSALLELGAQRDDFQLELPHELPLAGDLHLELAPLASRDLELSSHLLELGAKLHVPDRSVSRAVQHTLHRCTQLVAAALFKPLAESDELQPPSVFAHEHTSSEPELELEILSRQDDRQTLAHVWQQCERLPPREHANPDANAFDQHRARRFLLLGPAPVGARPPEETRELRSPQRARASIAEHSLAGHRERMWHLASIPTTSTLR